MLRAVQCRLQQTLVPNSGRSPEAFQQFFLRGEDDLAGDPSRLVQFANSRSAVRYFRIPRSTISIIS